MKKQGTGNRDQGTDRLETLLRNAVPPIDERAEETGDLWPAMERRLHAEPVSPPAKLHVRWSNVPWFDWALAGGLTLLLAAFPAWIPVVLYYL